LPYPISNPWILEEVSLSLALAREPVSVAAFGIESVL
jgi:hypothetical protein